MGTATLDNAEVKVLWAMTKDVELLRKIFTEMWWYFMSNLSMSLSERYLMTIE